MQEITGERLIGRRTFLQLGAAAGMTAFILGSTGCSPMAVTAPEKSSSFTPGTYTAR